MKALPLWCYAVICVPIVIIGVIFVPQRLSLSYAGDSCAFHPVLFPSLAQSRSDSFHLKSDDHIVVGDVVIASLGTCVTPIKPPAQGEYVIGVGVGVLPFLQKNFVISVPKRPVASTQALDAVPVTSDLKIPLSNTDDTFTYFASFNGGEKVECHLAKKELQCPIERLNLAQGETYTLSVDRYFGEKKIDNVILQKLTTLRSAKVLKTSIKNAKTVYSKLRSISVWFDKEITTANVELKRADGSGKKTPVTSSFDGEKMTIKWQEDLARRTKFALILSDLVARDGSGLDEDYRLGFTMSGGPKVTGINVGSYKVPAGFTATISFDQEISMSQNIAGHISATGGAKITGAKGKYAYVSFANVPRCGSVTITVDDSLVSKHGVSGGSAWRFTTRSSCQSVTTIGYSTQGRAINAYWFGSGSKTIMYTGAIHGDEASTYNLMLQWINALEAGYHLIPKGVRVVVVPAINPDGLARGTRTNARNVDLNRNFDTSDWKKNITNVYNQPFPGGGGSSRLSEPESQAIANLVSRLRPSVVVSFHSIGSVILSNPVAASSGYAQTYAAYSGYSYSTSSEGTFSYSITGTADDYYWEKLGVASIVVELGSHTYHQFPQNQNALWRMMR